MTANPRPLVAVTMGDPAGIGPEVIVRALSDERTTALLRPVVIGHPEIFAKAIDLVGADMQVQTLQQIDEVSSNDCALPCFNPCSHEVLDVVPGEVDPRPGRAAYDCLIAATQAALAGQVDAITTAPLNKFALHAAGLNYPGHTEILADQCGVTDFGMMLYMPAGEHVAAPHGLGVVHVTLHTSIRSVPGLLSESKVAEKIRLVDQFMRTLSCNAPRIGVCALNPHGGEAGLFGDEESRIIAPAVARTREAGIHADGPHPADTLMKRAREGEFDGIVAMYHDQGHIALKLLGFESAVNVTLGLPIVRTSPSHGTGFDIAWHGSAQPQGMVAALSVAALLTKRRDSSAVSADPS